ncbi:MAG TPA: DUF808 family protein, partial [Noviherbaspirillum sp.]
TPLLMVGGAFLCFEGVEKVFHKFLHSAEDDAARHERLVQAVQQTPQQLVELEKEKIKGAVRTDFILSAEIVAITLSTVQNVSLAQQAMVLVAISIFFTVGVYAVVAGVVKLDDAGIYLAASARKGTRAIGRFILRAAPWLMKTLSVVGTIAMFLVGGGIIVHGFPALHHLTGEIEHLMQAVPGLGATLAYIAPVVVNMIAGLLVGIAVLAVVKLYTRLFRKNALVH